jgi:hypothetical protein
LAARLTGKAETMRRTPTKTVTAATLAGLFLLTGAACSDEDGDGATTDEEVEDVESEAEKVQREAEQEVEGQDRGNNQDGE